MGRCAYDKIKDLEPAFAIIRKLEKIKEPKPGIFYLKSDGFLHFHEKDEKIWADIKDGKQWIPMDIPAKITQAFVKKFAADVQKIYLKQLK